MTAKEFMNKIANGKEDVLQKFLDLIKKAGADYCVIGGLAVNAYVEPVISLDLDLVLATKSLEKVRDAATHTFSIREFPHSLNFKSTKSDLRIQLQTDPRYQEFITRAEVKQVLGYEMKVAVIEDIIVSKVWAYSDDLRRGSKRQKDLGDIFRLVEEFPYLKDLLPEAIKRLLE